MRKTSEEIGARGRSVAMAANGHPVGTGVGALAGGAAGAAVGKVTTGRPLGAVVGGAVGAVVGGIVGKGVAGLAPAIEREATTSEIAQITAYLQSHLGQRVTGYLSGVKDAKIVGQWAAGRVQPRPLPAFRLRSAYQAARHIVEAYGDETAQAWFFGANAHLDDEAPAYVLRHGTSPEDWRFLLTAAKTFVETVP